MCGKYVWDFSGYVDLLTDDGQELTKGNYHCNDQAIHIHIFSSRPLDTELNQARVGRSELVPNAVDSLSTVRMIPIVRFHDWGEIWNENGEIQVSTHRYKTHYMVSQLVQTKYGWLRELEGMEFVGEVSDLEEDTNQTKEAKGKSEQVHYDHSLLRFKLENSTEEYCNTVGKLCSCKYSDYQMNYEDFQ